MSAREGRRQSPSSRPPLLTDDGMAQDRHQAVVTPIASRVVPKPVPRTQTEDPREFQTGQIRRRFNPKETRPIQGGTLFKFKLQPSDPDFPFDLSALECSLSVPDAYPEAKPSLAVGNRDIPRGFAFNIESGFDGLIQEKPDATLLELLKALDRNLELFLSAPKADTIKLVPNKDTRHLSAQPQRSIAPARGTELVVHDRKALVKGDNPVSIPTKPAEVFTDQQKEEASKRREIEVRQLEARMGRLPLYKKSGDGIAYTLPIEPRKRSELPPPLQAVKTVQLFVPLLYPLQPCRVRLDGTDSKESTAVGKGFELKAIEQKDITLMSHINYLAQNMHTLSKTPFQETPPPMSIVPEQPQSRQEDIVKLRDKGKSVDVHQDAERSHIQYVSRPPEWAITNRHDDSGSDSEYDSYDSGDEFSEDEDGEGIEHSQGEKTPQPPTQNPERGTAISFPFIELYGIELLEVATLNISVKCERCKEVTDVKGLKNGAVKSESCKKCATPLSIGFRGELVHAHAIRAGFLDLEGCTIADMLPSTFIPTCAECSTAYPAPGLISVRGETTTNVCRECHQRFTFKIPQTKFLRISSVDRLPSAGPRRKKETLGLTPGTELPKRGRCRHYTKSYRWFRFSCCQKVYTCDKCHDECEEHPHEWANRMVCGWCSREQNYRPEDCGICHRTLIGKKGGGGFWEGGKGTRDKAKMSRKDPRKFRRRGAATKAKA